MRKYRTHLPILGNVERPFEFQVLVFIIIDKGGNRGVVATSQHTRGSILLSN